MSDNNLKVQLPDSIDNALKNATDKPSQSIGELFNDIYTMIFGEFHAKAEIKRIRLAAGVEKFKEELDEEIKKIPSEKVIDPNFRLVSSALETSKYTVEEENIRKMFARLIAKSMNSDYNKYVHPSYVSILKDMSPLDAENFALFKNNNPLPIANYIIRHKDNSFSRQNSNVFISNPNNQNIDQQSQSITSLERMGIVSINYSRKILDANYDVFKQTDTYKMFEDLISTISETKFLNKDPIIPELFKENGPLYKLSNAKIEIEPGIVELNALGRDFIKVCL